MVEGDETAADCLWTRGRFVGYPIPNHLRSQWSSFHRALSDSLTYLGELPVNPNLWLQIRGADGQLVP